MDTKTCPECGGDGLNHKSEDVWEDCPDCNGDGWVMDSEETNEQD